MNAKVFLFLLLLSCALAANAKDEQQYRIVAEEIKSTPGSNFHVEHLTDEQAKATGFFEDDKEIKERTNPETK